MENKSIEDKGITEELIEDIIREAKILLNISDKEIFLMNDEALKLYAKMICQKILDKTNRKIFPTDLKYIVVEMLVDKYNEINGMQNILDKYFSSDETTSIDLDTISSLSEEGRTVSFNNGKKDIASKEIANQNVLINKMLEQKFEDYKTIINRYRLVYRV